MSAKTPIRRDDVVINPLTQRPIKVGNQTYMNLVARGVISAHFEDPKNLAPAPIGPPEVVDAKIKELNERLPIGVHAVRGRGQHKGQLVSRFRPITGLDATKYTARVASQAVAAHLDEIIKEPEDDEEMIGMIEKIILKEMMTGIAPPRKKLGRPPKVEEKYIELPCPEDAAQIEVDASFEPDIPCTSKVEEKHGNIVDNARKAVAGAVDTEAWEAEMEEPAEVDADGGAEVDAWADTNEDWGDE